MRSHFSHCGWTCSVRRAPDYSRSFTASSFVPYYTQSICSACVMHGADGILKGIRLASHQRLRAAASRA